MTPVLLAPAALALGLLLLGPLVAHLTRRRPLLRVPYGAMLLLERVTRRQRRRRQVHDRWVLLLRLLALLAVICALAQPELQVPDTPPNDLDLSPTVVIIDNSLSMDLTVSGTGTDRSSLYTEARSAAVALVRELPPDVLVAAVSMGGVAHPLVPSLTNDHGAVASALAELPRGDGETDLVGALSTARRILGGKGGRVVVFSDEAGPVAVDASRAELELMGKQNVALDPRPVRAPEVGNLFVTAASYGDGLEGGSVRVSVSNLGPRLVETPLHVRLPDGTEITAFVEVPAGGTAEESVTVPRVTEGGVATVSLEDPWLPADDLYAFHLPRVGASRVLVVDGDPGPTPTASEVYFLERALAPWGNSGGLVGGVVPQVTAAGHLPELDPDTHRVVFLANVSDFAPLAPALHDFVRQGGGLVITMGDNVTAERANPSLAGLLPVELRRPRALVAIGEDGVPTELPSVEHQLFEPFMRGGRAGFADIRWRSLFTVAPYEDVVDERETLLRTTSGLPLLIEGHLGRGRVLLFTGTIDLDWGNLPLQAIFMPFVQRVVSYLGGATAGSGARLESVVGQQVGVELSSHPAAVEVVGPGGPVAESTRGDTVFFVPSRAGAYRVETPGAPPLAWVAANTSVVESDVRPGPALIAVAAELDPERYLRRIALAPWLFGAAVLFLLGQAVLAWWRMRAVSASDNAEEVADAA